MCNVRAMRGEDLPEVLKISQECFGPDAWSRKAFEREFELKHSHKFVIEEGGKVVGYAVVWKFSEEVSLMSIAVGRDHWGKGYGKRLMTFLVEHFRDQAKRFFLDVRRSNVRAIRLYQSLGFRIVSERRGYYSDGESALQMALELQEAEDAHKGTPSQAPTVGGADTKTH
ncbi:MAG: ribosomal protein S18-alanine N-acetyltransferase [Aquificaceae bacterium]|nr:ribosomal protein S18-alanine N-acetyltransferase [Aquificaceae bacterium]MDW8096950.1 ribosomal protein S18-alanine N-acetyltransferase [Aquificaceae bacterium]